MNELLQRKKATNDIQKPATENTEESLLKYHDFDAPSMIESRIDTEISWSNDFDDGSSRRRDSFGYSSSDDDDEEEDDDGDEDDENENDDSEDIDGKIPGKLAMKSFLKQHNPTESSEDIVFGVDESFFQIGETSDSEVSGKLFTLSYSITA